MAAVAVVLLTSCSGDARGGAPQTSVNIRIGTFVPTAGARLANLLSREPLVAVEWDGRPKYRLATSATESDDGLTLTLSLRQGVKMHSGEFLTAEHVRESLTGRPLLMRDLADIQVPEAHTLVLTQKQPHALKLVDLGEFSIGDDEQLDERAGPFRIVSLQPPAVIEAFSDYYQGAPSAARIEIEEYPTPRAAWTAMMRGEINFLHEVNRDAIEFVQAGGDIRAYQLLRPYYVPLVFNLAHHVLRNPQVRVALSEAIDREEIVEKAMRGHGRVAEGPFWPHHWAYTATQRSAFRPDVAKLRLEAAGLPMRPARRGGAPSRFSFTCLIPEGDVRFERIALTVQRQLLAVGVDLRLETVPLKEFDERTGKGRFDAFLFEMVSSRTLRFAHEFWHSKRTPLRTGYTAADDALDRLKVAQTDGETRAAVMEVMRVLHADPPAAFLAWPREVRAADDSLELPYQQDHDVLGTLWQVRPKTAGLEHRR